MAELIHENGGVRIVHPANHKAFTLEELQGYVGGYIEVVGLADGRLLVVDEDGRSKGYAHNSRASRLTAGQVFGDIVGPALFCEGGEIE